MNTTKTSGVIRIVTLGASSTFGFRNRDNETYPYLLEQYLNRNSTSGETYEVINLGIPHLTSQQIAALFLAEALPLQPDIVTFYEGINDSDIRKNVDIWETEHDGLRKRMKRVSLIRRPYIELRKRLITFALVDNMFYIGVDRLSREEVENHFEPRTKQFLNNITTINDQCRKNDIKLVMANQQMKSMTIERENIKGVTYAEEVAILRSKLSDEGSFQKKQLFRIAMLSHDSLMEQAEAWAETNDVPFVDVVSKLDQRRDLLVTWVHLSAEGNQLVAEGSPSRS